jgi:hypothetical protein
MIKMTPYEKVSERLLRGQPKPNKFGKLIGGMFLTGSKSLHRTPQSVKWRTFWSLKQQRQQGLK